MQYNVEETYYSQLGINESADSTEIKAAYRKLAKEYHPDELPEELRNRPLGKLAEEAFRTIGRAYQVLSDPDRRRAYDEQLRRSRVRPMQSPSQSPMPPMQSVDEFAPPTPRRSKKSRRRKNWPRIMVGLIGLLCLLVGLGLLVYSVATSRF